MNIGYIFGGLLFLAFGVPQLGWPRQVWELQNFLWVKGGEPTEFALSVILVAGAIYSLIGLILICVGFAQNFAALNS